MMPSPFVLIALFLAFGLPGPDPTAPVTAWDCLEGLTLMLAALGAIGGGAAFAGWLVGLVNTNLNARAGYPEFVFSPPARMYLRFAPRAVEALVLATFAWLLFGVGWSGLVREAMPGGAERWILLDDLFVTAPYLIGLGLGWTGLYLGERAVLRRSHRALVADWRLGRYLGHKLRHSLALILPLVLGFALVQDLARVGLPELNRQVEFQIALTVALGLAIPSLVPLLLRRIWPTEPLPPGPLRDRLEGVSRRLRFPLADILVWKTGQSVATAAVTGLVPRWRYVLLTDALLTHLDDDEIESVFGHEIGHIARRHVPKFAAFFLASLGVVALGHLFLLHAVLEWYPGDPHSESALWFSRVSGFLALLAYFYVVFGHLSRQFEREADLFGARVVSASLESDDGPIPDAPTPAGIEVFARTLARVADLNGLPRTKWSWRHGSMDQRVKFLRALRLDPGAQAVFEKRLARFTRVLAAALTFAMVFAWCSGALELLH